MMNRRMFCKPGASRSSHLVLDGLDHFQFALAAVLCGELVLAATADVADQLVLCVGQRVLTQKLVEVFHRRLDHLLHSQWNLRNNQTTNDSIISSIVSGIYATTKPLMTQLSPPSSVESMQQPNHRRLHHLLHSQRNLRNNQTTDDAALNEMIATGDSAVFTHATLSASNNSWWRGTVVECRSLAGELSLSCARPAADG